MMVRQFEVHPAVVFTELEGSAVLLHLDSKRYYTLNSTGVAIWQGLVAGKDEAEIINAMLAEYDVTREHLSESVNRIINELQAAQLIKEKK